MLPLTTNFSPNVTEPSQGISYPVGVLCRRFTKLTGSCAYTLKNIVIRYPQQMVQMAFCDLSHTFHKQVINVSKHFFVILLWGILMSPLINNNFVIIQILIFTQYIDGSGLQDKWKVFIGQSRNVYQRLILSKCDRRRPQHARIHNPHPIRVPIKAWLGNDWGVWAL